MPDLRKISRDLIRKNPRNRRIVRNAKTYASLLASMRTKGFDEAHPLRVRPTTHPGPTSESFELVGGETRYDAGCELGIHEFPCIVEELSELEALVELAADNEQTPFTTIEKAMLLRDIEAAGGVITMVLPRLGLSDSEASRAKRALSVFDHSVAEGCAGASLSDKETFLYEISRLPKARWTELSKRVEKNDISRAALREMVERRKHATGKCAPIREPVRAVGGDNSDKVVKAVIAPAPGAHQDRNDPGEVAEQSHTAAVPPAEIDPPTVDRAHSSHEVTVSTTSSTAVGDVPILLVATGTALNPAGAWVTLDALAEIYELPCAPPGWGCAMRDGKPVFGPLRILQAPARSAPQSEVPPPTLPIAPVIALQDALLAGLTRVALTDELLAAIERLAPCVERTEITAFEAPAGIADSFDLVFGEGAPWFRQNSILPHEEQRKALAALRVSLVPSSEVYHDEQRRHLASQPGAIVYGPISSSSSRQHVRHVAAVTFEDDGSGPAPLAVTFVEGHVVRLPEARLHSEGGGSSARLFAVVKRRSAGKGV